MLTQDILKKFDIENPEEYMEKLSELDKEVAGIRDNFFKVWTYCGGCKGYAKVSEAYEDRVSPSGRLALKCGKCNTIWKFLK